MDKKNQSNHSVVLEETLANLIHVIRGKKIMLDSDLAKLYGVETRVLNQAVTRNIKRFPDDFMFNLSLEELKDLKSQSVTSSWGGLRKPPKAFTEQGVAMLSSVLNSEQAIQVNIKIMRVFSKLKEIVSKHSEVLKKIEVIEKRLDEKDEEVDAIFAALKELLTPPVNPKPKKEIGFHTKIHSKKS